MKPSNSRRLIAAAILCLTSVPVSAQIQVSYTAASPPPRPAAVLDAGHSGSLGGTEELGATTLWDQTEFGLTTWLDQVFTDFPTSDGFQVSDVSTGGDVWRVNKVTTYFTQGINPLSNWTPGTITMANLQVYPKTGTLPDDGTDIAPEYTVPITLVDDGGIIWRVEADTTGIPELQCITGDFWIGLTPITNYATDGQEFHWVSDAVGAESGFRNPGDGFGFGADWLGLSAIDTLSDGPPFEGSITLEGTVLVDSWVDLGVGTGLLSSFWGDVPLATGSGVPCFGSTVTVTAFHCGVPFGGTNLLVGFSSLFAPFKGGTLVPAPDLIIGLPTFADGDISVPFAWPDGIPAGFKLYLQFWQNEPPYSATNGLEVTAQ